MVGRQGLALGSEHVDVGRGESPLKLLGALVAPGVLRVLCVVAPIEVVRLVLGAARRLQQVAEQPVDGLHLVVHACLVPVPPRPGVPAFRVRHRVCFESPLEFASLGALAALPGGLFLPFRCAAPSPSSCALSVVGLAFSFL